MGGFSFVIGPLYDEQRATKVTERFGESRESRTNPLARSSFCSVRTTSATNPASGRRSAGRRRWAIPTASRAARPTGAFFALETNAPIVNDTGRRSTGPLTASLRWGLEWTIVAATLGSAAACVSTAPVDDPVDIDDSYSTCVDALGGMPDAIDHHIDACQAVLAASAGRR
jgi:hypothetical protein